MVLLDKLKGNECFKVVLLFIDLASEIKEYTVTYKTARYLQNIKLCIRVDYYDEFMLAQQILDPTYSITSAPFIEVSPLVIELTDCKKDKSIPLTITIKNIGQRPLKVSDILTSCTCVKLKRKKSHAVVQEMSVSQMDMTMELS